MDKKEFNLNDYYENILENKKQKKFFKNLICMKFNMQPGTFDQWIFREKIPGHSEVIIQDIIKEPKYNLPQL